MDFHNRVAIVTGAGSERGFGIHTARMLASRGCKVAAADINEAGALRTAEIIRSEGGEALGLYVDVTQEESVLRMVEQTVAAYGKIDILITYAGSGHKKDSLAMTLEDWTRIITLDLTSVYLCCHAVLPYMLDQGYGRIVNVSSISARNGGGILSGSHYCAARAGVIGYTKALAKEFAGKGITANCVCPGASNTDINGVRYENKPTPGDIPMKRRGDAAETAYAAVFLASERASYITGAALDVNGGAYMA